MSKTREAQSTFCWLIENRKQAGQGLAYRRMEQGLPVWTEDANKALWFVRREDAEAFAEEDREAERIVEHGFHAALAEPEQSPVVGSKTWFEDGKMVTQYLTEADVYKEPEQEPVMIYHGRHTIDCGEFGSHDMEMLKMIPAGTKLYTSPREWQELSEHDIEAICAKADKALNRDINLSWRKALITLTSAALRAKNGG